MQVFTLGKVSVPTAGTAVSLATALPANFPSDHKCYPIIVSPPKSNTGVAVFGTSGNNAESPTVVASTLVGAIKEFLPTGSTGIKDSFELEDDSGFGNNLHIDDYALDTAVNGEGLIFVILVR